MLIFIFDIILGKIQSPLVPLVAHVTFHRPYFHRALEQRHFALKVMMDVWLDVFMSTKLDGEMQRSTEA